MNDLEKRLADIRLTASQRHAALHSLRRGEALADLILAAARRLRRGWHVLSMPLAMHPDADRDRRAAAWSGRRAHIGPSIDD